VNPIVQQLVDLLLKKVAPASVLALVERLVAASPKFAPYVAAVQAELKMLIDVAAEVEALITTAEAAQAANPPAS
jgi:hypothetical protein